MKKIFFKDINIDRVDNFLKKQNEYNINSQKIPYIQSVEFSINGACNRRCFFCPRVDEKKYKNIYESLPMEYFLSVLKDLKSNNYNGRFSFSGFCEPLLTKDLYKYIKNIKLILGNVEIEIVTNGDPLKKNGETLLKQLFDNGLTNIRISLYDNENQIKYFNSIKKSLMLNDEQFILRKRYLGPAKSYGMTISNRAGSIEIKNDFFELKKLPEPLKESCYYPMYKVLIDYNGDVLMCSNDWKKQQIMGNVKNSTISNIWNSEKFIEMRKKLIKKDRNHLACNVCDVNGRLNGEAPFKSWVKYFKNSK